MERWRDRVAIVTGGSSGIGEAIVRSLAAAGMKVAALARRSDKLQELEKELNADWIVKGLICDVTKEEDVEATFRWVIENWGPVSLLVNNAGIFLPVTFSGSEDTESLKSIFETNVFALMSCSKRALDCMKTHNIEDGHLININSTRGHTISHKVGHGRGCSAYSASKHAVTVLSSTLRSELREDNLKIKVTSISPGRVWTELTERYILNPEQWTYLKVEDVVKAVNYVLSAPVHVNVSELTIEPV